MQKLIIALFFVSSLLSLPAAIADEDDDYLKAVERTQKDLSNAESRKGMINTKEAGAAADNVKDITGGNSADQEAIYRLSSQILGEIKGKDAESLKKALFKAQGDPKAFMESLPPDLQKQIRELAGRIEDRKKKNP